MGGSKGGAPTPGAGSTTSSGIGTGSSMSNQTVTQSPSGPAMDAYQQLLDAGNYWYQGIPYNEGFNKQVAPFDPGQTDALARMWSLGTNASVLGDSVGAAGSSIYDYGQHTGEWDPAQVRAIESPHTQDVVDKTQNWFNNQNSIQGNSLIGQSIKSGNAFGGDRAGVAEGQLAGQQQIAQAPVIAGLYQSGYTQALDEYNRLKALGIQGQQLGLAGQQLRLAGGQYGMQGAEEAFKSASLTQQQQQREMDATTQNNILSQTFGPQMLNWYASLVGGVGPLMGGSTNAASSGATTSSTSGVTNPPAPNQLVQGLGLASSAIGLGKSLFGKRGGPVGFKSGGNVDDTGEGDSQSQDNSGDQTILVDPSRGASILSSPGLLSSRLGPAKIPTPRVIPFPQLMNTPQARVPSISSPAATAPTTGGNSWMDTLGAGLGLAAKAVPLFLKDGGRVAGLVPRMQNGGDFYDEEDATDSPIGMPEDQPEAHSLINVSPDASSGNAAMGSAAVMPSLGMMSEGPATGSPAGLPELQPDASSIRVPSAAGLGPPGAMAGGRGGGRGVTQYPGLAPAAPTVAQKMATDPFLAAGIAMLRSRSPYFGAGVGEGLAGAQHAMAGRAQQERLDNKPQMITHGETVQFRVGDKVIDTGIRTQAAMQSEERRLDRESRADISRQRQEAITGRKGTPSEIEAGRQERARDAEIRRLTSQEHADAKQRGEELSRGEARSRAIESWNSLHPDKPIAAPPLPPKPEKPAKPKEEPGPIERGWNYLTKPATPPATAPVTPSTKPPGVPEVRAPQAVPDLGAALKSGQTNQAEVLAQARAKIAREPGTRAAVIARLQQHGIDVSSLSETAPAIPMSQ